MDNRRHDRNYLNVENGMPEWFFLCSEVVMLILGCSHTQFNDSLHAIHWAGLSNVRGGKRALKSMPRRTKSPIRRGSHDLCTCNSDLT